MAKKKQAAENTGAEKRWRKLTWDDLEAYTGSRSLERGRSYQRSGRVKQLARTRDGDLLAWVHGGERYVTEVGLGEGRRSLWSTCTCPIGAACKHVVAVVVEYLDALEKGRDVPLAADDDPRWERLETEEAEDFEEDWDEDDWHEDDWEETDEDEESEPARAAVRRGGSSRSETRRSKKGAGPEEMRRYLEGLPAAELVSYVLQLADQYPEISHELKASSTLARGEVGEVVREARKEIQRLTAEPAWVNSWTGEGNLPDYSGLKRLFERLLQMGQADALLELGETVLEKGQRQIEEGHEEGETGSEIADCLAVVFRAVPASSRPDPEKVLYAIDMILKDSYDLSEGVDAVLDRKWAAKTWSNVADRLASRLQALPAPKREDFSSRYGRDRVSHWLIEALRKARREQEIIPLMEEEARATGSYERLVDELIAAHRHDEAKRWALEGIGATQQQWPGIANHLREKLRTLAEHEKDWPLVAAMRAEDFFSHPSLQGLTELDKSAARAGCGPAVHAAALHFLETGVRPQPPAPAPATVTKSKYSARSKAAAAPASAPVWPLPEVPADLRQVAPARRSEDRPHFDVLLELALKEKRPDDVLRWFDRLREGRRGASLGYGVFQHASLEGRVADAVAGTHLDRATEIYRTLIQGFINRANPSAYEEALPYLRKLRDVLGKAGRAKEWQQYLARLRETEKRKRRLLEILDRLERRPIVGS
jgi:uncharacterized Zn finger protein